MRRLNVMFLVIFFVFIAAVTITAQAGAAEKPVKGTALVADGKTVKVNYTLTVDGKVIYTSKGRQPFEFKEGTHQIVPGFEKAVMGMKAGGKKSFKVKPEDGYGPVDPNAIKEVPIKTLPAGVTPKAGMTLLAQTKDGRNIPVTIKEVKKDVVVMDLNHPLAGKTLSFDVEVVEIK